MIVFFFFWSDYIVNQEGWDSITCIVCVVYNNVYIVVQCASKNFFGGPKSCFVWFVCTQRTWLGTIGTYSIMSSCSYSILGSSGWKMKLSCILNENTFKKWHNTICFSDFFVLPKLLHVLRNKLLGSL